MHTTEHFCCIHIWYEMRKWVEAMTNLMIILTLNTRLLYTLSYILHSRVWCQQENKQDKVKCLKLIWNLLHKTYSAPYTTQNITFFGGHHLHNDNFAIQNAKKGFAMRAFSYNKPLPRWIHQRPDMSQVDQLVHDVIVIYFMIDVLLFPLLITSNLPGCRFHRRSARGSRLKVGGWGFDGWFPWKWKRIMYLGHFIENTT